MGGHLVRCRGPAGTSESRLLGSGSESRYDFDRTPSLLKVIVSRKLNTTHDIRFNGPSFRKVTEISVSEYLTGSRHLPTGYREAERTQALRVGERDVHQERELQIARAEC